MDYDHIAIADNLLTAMLKKETVLALTLEVVF